MLAPLHSIKQLVTAYGKHQRVTGILEGCRDAVIGAYLGCAIVRACTIEAKEQSLNLFCIIAINRIMHHIVDGFPLWQSTGKKGLRIDIMCSLACLYSRCCCD